MKSIAPAATLRRGGRGASREAENESEGQRVTQTKEDQHPGSSQREA